LVGCGVALITVAAVAYFLPAILFLMDRSGLKIVDPREVVGLEIEIGEGWFPLYSSTTAMGRLIIPPTNPKTVVFCRVDWITPWACERVWMYRNAISVETMKSRELFSSIEQYTWGRVGIVRDEATQTPGRKLAMILDHGVAISAANLGILRDIKRIEE
jgi:hypothetical protein